MPKRHVIHPVIEGLDNSRLGLGDGMGMVVRSKNISGDFYQEARLQAPKVRQYIRCFNALHGIVPYPNAPTKVFGRAGEQSGTTAFRLWPEAAQAPPAPGCIWASNSGAKFNQSVSGWLRTRRLDCWLPALEPQFPHAVRLSYKSATQRMSCVDGFCIARINLMFWRGGRVQSCVRPVGAVHMTAGLDGMHG
jgi:hypothetical protein